MDKPGMDVLKMFTAVNNTLKKGLEEEIETECRHAKRTMWMGWRYRSWNSNELH
jgi:hypothetical protein